MKKIVSFVISICSFILISTGQNVGISDVVITPDASSILELRSPDKGLLIPRVALTQTTSNFPVGAGIATSLIVYNTVTVNDVVPGYYYWDGTQWVRLATGGSTSEAWHITGNSGTIDGTHFLGTTDLQPLNFRVNNERAGRIDDEGNTILGYQALNQNISTNATALGFQALFSNTTGESNTAIGLQTLYSNTVGDTNTAVGAYALESNTTGKFNTSTGALSLSNNTIGSHNTAHGTGSLYSNTEGVLNTAMGFTSLSSNVDGESNTALGSGAMHANVGGSENVAVGAWALATNMNGNFNVAIGNNAQAQASGEQNVSMGTQALFSGSGSYNVAVGSWTLNSNTTGWQNVALGHRSLHTNESGHSNVGVGAWSLNTNNDGIYNVAVGDNAMQKSESGNRNVSVGNLSMVENISGHENTAVGSEALSNNTTGNNNVALGRLSGNNMTTALTGNNNTFLGSNSTYANTAGTIVNATAVGANVTLTNSNTLILGNSANVGVGTTSPEGLLHLRGTALFFYLDNPSGNKFALNSTNAGDLRFLNMTGPVTYPLTILGSTGNVGISNTSPSSLLSVGGTGNVTYAVYGYKQSITAAAATGVYGDGHRDVTTGSTYGVRGNARSEVANSTTYGVHGFALNASGTGTVSYGVYGHAEGSGTRYGVYCAGNGGYTGTWSLISDRKFKKNIQPMSGILDKVLLLEPKTYEMKTDEYPEMSFNDGLHFGLIAQELKDVFPWMVTQGAHPSKDGGIIEFESIDYIALVPVLIQAIQEQQKIIENLQEQINQLKEKE